MTQARCAAHGGLVPTHQTQEIRPGQLPVLPGATADEPLRACLDCVRTRGLLTVNQPAALIGRPDGTVIIPGRPS